MKHNHIQVIQLLESQIDWDDLENRFIKINVLADYLRSKKALDSLLREHFSHTAADSEHFALPDDPPIILDDDGDLALRLSYAEGMLIYGASQRHFECALALILIIETCYEPSAGSPCRLNAVMRRFQPLIQRDGLPPAALLHQFLEVDEPVETWFSRHINTHGLVRGDDYFIVPPEAPQSEMALIDDDEWETILMPETSAKMACATPTIRGRKLKACLIDPGVYASDYWEQDPALLEVLFTPPSRGVASL